MGKKSKGKQKKNDNVIKPLLTELFQKCVNPTVSSTPSQKELFDAYKEIVELLEIVEKHRGESFLRQLPRRDQSLNSFYVWAKEQGIVFGGVEIKPIRNDELGVFASKEFSKADMFIKIPRSSMMASDCFKESSISSLIDSDPMLSSMPNVALAVHLLCEAYNKASKWKPYINILPRHYTNVLYFDTSEIENLKGTSVFRQTIHTIQSIVRQYAYLSNLFYKSPVARELGIADKFSYADYRWAVATLMTRQNPLPPVNGAASQVIALIPYLDLCNHKEGTVSIDYNPETMQCECSVMESVKTGSEMLIYYGPRPNTELVIYNGFFYQNNSHDFIKIKFCLSKTDPNHDSKQMLITKLGIGDTLPIGCMPSPIKDTLWAFLLIASLNESELQEILKSDDDEVATKLHSGKSFSIETRIRGFMMLRDRCDLCLKVIPDIDEDIKMEMEDEQLPYTKMLSLSIKINEKRILREAISFVENELSYLQDQ